MKKNEVNKWLNIFIILLLVAGLFNVASATVFAASATPSCGYIVEE